MALTKVTTEVIDDSIRISSGSLNVISGSKISTGSFGRLQTHQANALFGSRTVTLGGDLTTGGALTTAGTLTTQNNNVTINAVGAARTLTLNESLTVGDGNDGTITFSGASKTLTVEDTSLVNQDLTSDASPTFAGATITGTLTAQEFKTEFVSASITFSSGSTIFGDTPDDVHERTGSFNVSGSLTLGDGNLVVNDKVGIGVNNPSDELEVHGATAAIKIRSTGTSAGNNPSINFQSTEATGLAARAEISADDDGATTKGALIFKTRISDSVTEAMRIDGTGDVGIGTATAASKLHNDNAVDQTAFFVDSNYRENSRFHSTENNQGTRVWITNGSLPNDEGYGFVVGDGGNHRMTIGQVNTAGSFTKASINISGSAVGINDTDPSHTLVVKGISGTSPIINVINSDTEDNDTGRESTIRFSGFRSGGEAVDNGQITGTHDGSSDDDKGMLTFFTNGGSGQAERMRILSDGRVAIKATSLPQDFGGERGQVLISSVDNAGANNYGVLQLQGHSISNGVGIGGIYFYDHDSNNALIQAVRQNNNGSAKILFYTSESGGSVAERMAIYDAGNVEVTDGNLIIGTSGHGIDFSATSDATGMETEVLDDYEEGSYTPTSITDSLTFSSAVGRYTKIGRICFVRIAVTYPSNSGTATPRISLPFTAKSDSVNPIANVFPPHDDGVSNAANGLIGRPNGNQAFVELIRKKEGSDADNSDLSGVSVAVTIWYTTTS